MGSDYPETVLDSKFKFSGFLVEGAKAKVYLYEDPNGGRVVAKIDTPDLPA